MLYLTLKTFHIFFVLLWIAGLLMQAFILLVSRTLPGPPMPEERSTLRLLIKWNRFITTPAMVFALSSGVGIGTIAGWFGNGWLSAKIAIVMLLAGIHGVQAGKLRRMLTVGNTHTGFDPRVLLPVILGAPLVIVFLVILKPF
ncbi:putative membrane protein [Pseudomonas sp. BIGb0408]|uniref:Protoporphyrinogen IX oxidase n=1 Tax=Phytopseudomonas flavescens TaxID=29435 RepID=A0A7Z0BPN7_9GAMM|nr:CopD family protein [Pseudomonas sp. BIGb0408]MCW2293137.1 putative membrane protein [Pseudomonas sp. BIGb0408]NYH72293.1 putative membrane protein [Pseudomonas flavescens]